MLFGQGAHARGRRLVWTPNVFSGTGSITTATYNTNAAFRIGQFVWFTIDFTISVNGTGATSIWVSVPQAATRASTVYGWESAGNQCIGILPADALHMNTNRFDNGYYGANGIRAVFTGWYEAAL